MGIVKPNFSHLLVMAQKENGGLWTVLRGVVIHANTHTQIKGPRKGTLQQCEKPKLSPVDKSCSPCGATAPCHILLGLHRIIHSDIKVTISMEIRNM